MEGGELEPRVSALEGEIREMRARLRISERAELRDFRRATVGSFHAVREDLLDLRAEVADLRTEMRSGFGEMRSKFDLTAAGQRQILGILQTLIDRRTADRRHALIADHRFCRTRVVSCGREHRSHRRRAGDR